MYSITLEDHPASITEQAKLNAAYRFQRVLAYRIWQNAMDSDESELSEDDKTLAKKWIEVASKA